MATAGLADIQSCSWGHTEMQQLLPHELPLGDGFEMVSGVCGRKKECVGAGISGGGHRGPTRQGACLGG